MISKKSNLEIIAELNSLLKSGSELQWYVKQQLIKKGFTVENLETGKKLMNLKLERKRNGIHLRFPRPDEWSPLER